MPKGIKTKLVRFKSFLFENKSISQTIAKNTLWLSFGEVGGRLLRVIIIFYAARVLGAAGWGTLSYMTSLAAIFTVFSDIGLSGVLIREAAKDAEKKSTYFSTSFSLKAVLILVSFLFIVFGSEHITGIPLTPALIYATGALFIFDSLRRFGTSLFRAEERMEIEAIINIVTQLIIVIAGFVVLSINPSPESLAMAYAIGSGIGLVGTIHFLRKDIKKIFSHFDRKLIMPIINAAWPMTLASIFGILLVNIDTVMIGWFRNAAQVGFYSAAQKPIAFFYLLPAFIVGGLFPALSRLAHSKSERFKEVMEQGISTVMLVAYPLVLSIFFFAESIITFFYGTDFVASAGPLRILSLTVLITFPATIMIHAMFAQNRQREMVPLWTLGCIANILLNLWLIPVLGIMGATWASLMTQIVTNGLLWKKMRGIIPFSVFHDAGPAIKSAFVMVIVMFFLEAVYIPFFLIMIFAAFAYLGALMLFRDPTLAQIQRTLFHSEHDS